MFKILNTVSVFQNVADIIRAGIHRIVSREDPQGSQELWRSWKTWKITKSSMHGKIIDLKKP